MSLAFFLLGILLTTVWSLYHQILSTRGQIQAVKQTAFDKLLLHQRLSLLFSSLRQDEEIPCSISSCELQSPYSSGLLCQYVNKVDPEPNFCGKLTTLLFVNSNKELCLLSWNEKEQTRLEVLKQDIKKWHFSLFDTAQKKWVHSWPSNGKASPAMIKITVESKEGTDMYPFFLLDFSDPILYAENAS